MTHEKLLHIDLFSGIGGFALAADRIFGDVEHIFCDNEPFAQEVLKKHWPESYIYSDIRSFTADAERERHLHGQPQKQSAESKQQTQRQSPTDFHSPFLLTGGFPCQPFSQAGRRRGEEDDRFLWPEMLRVIREFSPLWVIAENVRGLLTQGGGVVFERVCTDLEAAGYEVQPIVLPAVAVGAPHRRDRVWFVARRYEREYTKGRTQGLRGREPSTFGFINTSNSRQQYGSEGRVEGQIESSPKRTTTASETERHTRPDWRENWLEVATRLCRVDDGVRNWMDGRGKIRNSRNNRLKALGNAIVPQVAMEIMLAIKSVDDVL